MLLKITVKNSNLNYNRYKIKLPSPRTQSHRFSQSWQRLQHLHFTHKQSTLIEPSQKGRSHPSFNPFSHFAQSFVLARSPAEKSNSRQ
jgi:hypothetical protein